MNNRADAEILRVLRNAEELYSSEIERLPEVMRDLRRVGDIESHVIMHTMVEGVSNSLLLIGMIYWRIQADKDRSVETFSRIRHWSPIALESFLALSKGRVTDLPVWPASLSTLLCFVLSGNMGAASEYACSLSDHFFMPTEKVHKVSRQVSRFSQGFCKAIQSAEFVYSEAAGESSGKMFTAGYGDLLARITTRDLNGINTELARCRDGFKRRALGKADFVDRNGYGQLSQAAVFDALGTALCRVALWKGIEGIALPDDHLYPKEFILLP